jgi:hypothetical protein
MDLVEMDSKYGSVVFEGKKYILCDQTKFTGNLLDILPDSQDLDGNGESWFEMSAPAVDEDGNDYTVYWVFCYEGPERKLDSYDYDNVDRVVENRTFQPGRCDLD